MAKPKARAKRRAAKPKRAAAKPKRAASKRAASKRAASKRAASKRAASKRAASKRAASKRAASKRAASKRAASKRAAKAKPATNAASARGIELVEQVIAAIEASGGVLGGCGLAYHPATPLPAEELAGLELPDGRPLPPSLARF